MKLENKMTSERQQGGRQRDWDEVRKHSDQPIITIITSTYNVVQDLQWTIDSIKEQTYPNIQWIIADGASTDGTVAMFEANIELIDYWFSEPDTGIYDAWNKALEHVEGDWVQFIGAGDALYETNTLEKVVPYLKDAYPNYELVYGQVMHISEKGRKELYVSGEPWENYQGKWSTYIRPKIPEHPAIYHHVSLFQDIKFDTKLKISADSLFILQALKQNNTMLFIDIIVDKFVIGGISDSFESFPKIYNEMRYIKDIVGFSAPLNIRTVGKTKYWFKTNLIKVFGIQNSMKITDSIRVLIGKERAWTKDRE